MSKALNASDAAQVEMEFMVAGPDLGILSETSRMAGLGKDAAAVFSTVMESCSGRNCCMEGSM